MTRSLTDEERAICSSAGITETAYLAQWEAAPIVASAMHHGLTAQEFAICHASGVSPAAFAAVRDGNVAVLTSGVGVSLAACAFKLPTLAVGSRVASMQLTPAGAFLPSDGRKMDVPHWRVDAAIAARVIATFKQRANPPVVDYEHQTLNKEKNGQPAPAAGWITDIQWREGSGLWADVELTERAADLVRADEYRYVSPVFRFDAKTGDVLSVEMAAITNNPAIDGMEPLALRAAATFGHH